jgi:SRSO17 transposase
MKAFTLTRLLFYYQFHTSRTLPTFQQKLGKNFARAEARRAAFDYIQALLSQVERKNGWQMAEQVGYANPYRFQHLLGRAQWNADAVVAFGGSMQ